MTLRGDPMRALTRAPTRALMLMLTWGAGVVTVLDRFLAAGVSRETFDAHLAARRVAVDGQRVTDPATPAPLATTVGVMLDPE